MPTRFVTLMNPRPRRARRGRRSRMLRSRTGRFVSRRRSHRNPTRRRRRARAPRVIYRTRTRRVYRARRRTHRRRSTAIMVAPRRRIRRRRYSVMRRRYHRNGSRSSFGGGRGLIGSFKSALSKPLLMKAGGAVAGSFLTGYIMNRFGASLPMSTNPYVRVVYTLGIPVTAAYLIRNKNRDVAEGLVIGGLVMSINSLMSQFNIGGPAAPAAAPAAVGAYAVAGELGNFGYYPQHVGDTRGLGGSNVAFAGSAW